MVDEFALYGIIVRSVAAVFLGLAIVQQISLFKFRDLYGLKKLFLSTLVALFIGNIFAIILNFFRGDDGNLVDTARQIGIVFNSTATLLAAISFYLIYIYRDRSDK